MSDDRRILLLRGVNVGSNRKLPMADLRAALTGLGLEKVTTHIQSGNAVFRDPARRAGLGADIAQALAADFPVAPEALIFDPPAFAAILAANPFGDDTAQIGFLARPAAIDDRRLDGLTQGEEAWQASEAAIYLHLPHGVGRSKLAAGAENAVGAPLTMRNPRVCRAILTLAEEL
ncbi:DUF1697 domain-containing protein [Pararhodobacter marinus]|uniref:DUF1697 domain-containing protein n=1 Tax=Pararhodobacter marinus TaxID=2184063 RepID=UPI003510F61E